MRIFHPSVNTKFQGAVSIGKTNLPPLWIGYLTTVAEEFCTPTATQSFKIANLTRKFLPKTKIIAGNVRSSYFAEDIVERELADFPPLPEPHQFVERPSKK